MGSVEPVLLVLGERLCYLLTLQLYKSIPDLTVVG